VVDRTVLAAKTAAVRDAVARVREVLPEQPEALGADRTAREVVVLNLFVALQECVNLATHWLADEGHSVPGSYREVFLALSERSVIARALAERLAAASGFRNLVAHRYGLLDPALVHRIASRDLEDLLDFCAALAARAGA
jgi:uncharacterized protein YutE (UPF0331/DUF86 family)